MSNAEWPAPTSYKEVTITPCSSGFGEYQIGEANGEAWASSFELMHAMDQGISFDGAYVTWDGEMQEDIRGSIHCEDELLHIMCAHYSDGDFNYFGIVEA